MADRSQLLDPTVIRRYPSIAPRSWELSVLRGAWEEPIGIWEVVILAREQRPALVREEILRSLDRLMTLGLIEAGVPSWGGDFDRWPGSRQEILSEIERQWRALGRDPWLGDIVWFGLTPAGIEMACSWPLLRFRDEPRGDLYRSLLDWLIARSDQFILIIREEPMAKSPAVYEALTLLEPWRIDRGETGHWPGMTLLAGTATIVRHRCRPSPASVLARLADGPFDWRHPHLPEDLSFLDSSGDALLVNVAHDQSLALDLSPQELDDLRRDSPEIVGLLR